MRNPLLKAAVFLVAAIGMLIASGPLVAVLVSMAGVRVLPAWAYACTFSTLLLAATGLALHFDGTGLARLGLVPTRKRVRELAVGLGLSVVLFGVLALVRGATIDAAWSFAGSGALSAAGSGLAIAFFLLLPEELLFRGYAFQRLVDAIGTWPGILFSALLFGIYHLAGSGMWGIGAFFQFAMPALGGVVFGWAAVRTRGLALPIGLHLGGNWVQFYLFSFQPQTAIGQTALWNATVTDAQQRILYAPDLGAQLPYIATLFAVAMAVHLAVQRQQRAA
jgi:membrane protease YdiL (CAAX protease family)